MFKIISLRIRNYLLVLSLFLSSGLCYANEVSNENKQQALAADNNKTEAKVVQMVYIRLPLTGNDDRLYQGQIQRVIDKLSATKQDSNERPTLVLEIVPSESGKATEFERAIRLARFLTSQRLSSIKTVAYLPKSIDGHAVLLALACEEIAMAPDAQIGLAGKDEDAGASLEPIIRAGYEQISQARRTAPVSVAIAMADRSEALTQIETESGIDYVLNKDLIEARDTESIVEETLLSPQGDLAQFTGREARDIGFVRYLASDRNSLARLLGTTVESLNENRATRDSWQPVMIDLEGPLTSNLGRRIETIIGTEIKENGTNWFGIRIDSEGGDWQTALRLAKTLAELNRQEAHTVAYVPRRAEGPAALVALACHELVLQEGAELKGSEPLDSKNLRKFKLEPKQNQDDAENDDDKDKDEDDDKDRRVGAGKKPVDPQEDDRLREARDELDALLQTIREDLTPSTTRTWSLLAAVADADFEVSQYRNRESGEVRLFTEAELADQDDPRNWQEESSLVTAGEAVKLSSEQASDFQVSDQTVSQFDDLAALYGFETTPRTAKPNWALEFVAALASPGFAALLLVIGLVGLYIEISTPGLGIGGFIAALAFTLFFWSKYLDGTADWLEAMLFVLGFIFLLIELLVLPGFGIFGLGGALLIVSSLILASQTFILPKTEAQMSELRDTLATIIGSGVAFMIIGIVLRQYLPHSSLFRHMTQVQDEADRIEQANRETLAHYEHLVGQSGITTTPLMPSGRAEIAGEIVDVITNGEAVERGESVLVVSAQANRVVVKTIRA